MKIISKIMVLSIIGLFFGPAILSAESTLQEDKINTNIQGETSGTLLFRQSPVSSQEKWQSITSDLHIADHGYEVYENFWGVEEAINKIVWWGFTIYFVPYDQWYPGDPEGMNFNIRFFDDSIDAINAPPNELVSSFCISNKDITIHHTGIIYEDMDENELELIRFEYTFSSPIQITNDSGWISIQSYNDPEDDRFTWINSNNGDKFSYQQHGQEGIETDLSFCLYNDSFVQSELRCSGNFVWNNVKPGDFVNDEFTIENVGTVDSLLNWSIASYPSWGTWTFTPSSGTSVTVDESFTVNILVEAPDVEEASFTGEIKIVNDDYSEDFDIVPVSLSTPKNKDLGNPLLHFIRQHSCLYSLLQLIFER